MFSSTSKTGTFTWALVFLGGVVLVADIASMQMMGGNAKQFQFVTAPAQPVPAVPVPKLPEGQEMVSLPFNPFQGSEFIVPGSRVDLIGSVWVENKVVVFKLSVSVLIVAVDTDVEGGTQGAVPTTNTVSLAVTKKQALALSLAQSRGCAVNLVLPSVKKRDPADHFDIDEVVKYLEALPPGGDPAVRFDIAPPPRPVDR